jgi:hypothetical protein
MFHKDERSSLLHNMISYSDIGFITVASDAS